MRRVQGDIIPEWTITIFEGSYPLISKEFKGNYSEAVIKAQNMLDTYEKLDDIFNTTHYEIS